MNQFIKARLMTIILGVLVLCVLSCDRSGSDGESTTRYSSDLETSGEVINWYRQLFLSIAPGDTALTVIQGEYIKIFIQESLNQHEIFQFEIPDLEIDAGVRGGRRTKQYFKFTEAGDFDFTLADAEGTIKVLEYRKPRYRDVEPADALSLVLEVKPLLLDVREPEEYRTGTIGKALNIPVEELPMRLSELALYRHKSVMVYGKTGRLSNDAAKILRKDGFTELYHLKHGIVGWASQGYSVKFF